jgi:hypothetical protein
VATALVRIEADARCQDGTYGDVWLTADPKVNELLAANPLALLIGMLLDQQVAMERRSPGRR